MVMQIIYAKEILLLQNLTQSWHIKPIHLSSKNIQLCINPYQLAQLKSIMTEEGFEPKTLMTTRY